MLNFFKDFKKNQVEIEQEIAQRDDIGTFWGMFSDFLCFSTKICLNVPLRLLSNNILNSYDNEYKNIVYEKYINTPYLLNYKRFIEDREFRKALRGFCGEHPKGITVHNDGIYNPTIEQIRAFNQRMKDSLIELNRIAQEEALQKAFDLLTLDHDLVIILSHFQ